MITSVSIFTWTPMITSVSGIRKWNSPYVIGIKDGIEIRVDFYPNNHPRFAGQISTAYPINVTPNP